MCAAAALAAAMPTAVEKLETNSRQELVMGLSGTAEDAELGFESMVSTCLVILTSEAADLVTVMPV